jgi:hypothetical protein
MGICSVSPTASTQKMDASGRVALSPRSPPPRPQHPQIPALPIKPHTSWESALSHPQPAPQITCVRFAGGPHQPISHHNLNRRAPTRRYPPIRSLLSALYPLRHPIPHSKTQLTSQPQLPLSVSILGISSKNFPQKAFNHHTSKPPDPTSYLSFIPFHFPPPLTSPSSPPPTPPAPAPAISPASPSPRSAR